MSYSHLACFVNNDRPFLLHPSVVKLDVHAYDAMQRQELEESLKVPLDDHSACAAAARLWESLLESHRTPFLLIRVADMQFALESRLTALSLYEEAQTYLNDPAFGRWIAGLRVQIMDDVKDQLFAYKFQTTFTPSQRWKSAAKQPPFPYCKLQSADLNALRTLWKSINGTSDEIMNQFLNLHCLETNAIEGMLKLESSTASRLTLLGFFGDENPISRTDIVNGQTQDRAEAIHLLQDTFSAFREAFHLVTSDTAHLTPETVCRLHKILMWSCHIVYVDDVHHPRFAYVNAGLTRQSTGVNVTIRDKQMKIQFCPHDEVDSELATFCARFNELLQQPKADPFASAAWISDVFLSIHPFEDGNGRLARILSSIPLLRHNLPPICILLSYRRQYLAYLNAVRANRDGDYSEFMQCLYKGTKQSVHALRDIIARNSTR